jgi:hypothetical protein
VNEKFRDVCGISAKMEWPTNPNDVRLKEGTNEQYFTPNFNEEVSHLHNRTIFRKVQSLIISDFEVSMNDHYLHKLVTHSQQDPKNIPMTLQHELVYYNKDTIYELTKNAFRNFKPKARAQGDPTVKERLNLNAKLSRRRDRRKTVSMLALSCVHGP